MKLVLQPINPTVGDIDGNSSLMLEAMQRNASADLIVFPELSIIGYPPRDLLLYPSVITACEAAIHQITRDMPDGLTAIVGALLPHLTRDGCITNSLVVLQKNTLLARYDKRLLPNYDVFDEQRYFVPGDAPVVVELAGERIGLSICEDLWRGSDAGSEARYTGQPDPISELTEAGASMIVNASASPFVAGKQSLHRELLSSHARRHCVPVMSINQFGANDDLIFDGAADAFDDRGRLCGENGLFQSKPLAMNTAELRPCEPDPIEPILATIEALTLGVRDYAGKTGFRTACLGLSGGIDSAVTAAIGARAIGGSNIVGVAMPGKYSSGHALDDARDLAGRLGCEFYEAPIAEPFEGFRERADRLFNTMGLPTLGQKMPDITEENLQSRIRGTMMMALSNRTGSLLLTTGNKSELAVGYGTLYGDMNGGLAVISDILKNGVYDIARYCNDHYERLGFASPPIPESTITKPPSAELAPGQKDEDSLPPYDVLDKIVHRRVELRQSRQEIVHATGFDEAVVAKMLRLIAINEYKRFQLAIGLKVSTIAFGPGRRMPLAAKLPPKPDQL